jgi:CRP-like cAMP-binding protein
MTENRLQQIQQVLSSYITITEEEWNLYAPKFTIKHFTKNQMVLSPGSVCKEIYFVNSGLLRVFFVDQKEDEHTFHFSLENTFSADYESFLKKTASNYSIQAMEQTEVVVMSFDALHQGYTILQQGEKLGRKLAEDYFFIFSNKIQSLYTESPLERYNKMNVIFPGIVNRVSQHYIASYLNVSSVHLSRLKNA